MKWTAGYNVALVSTVALACSAPGQTLLVSLLNVPLRQAFDLDPLWLNSSYTVATIVASLPLVFIGRLLDRVGPRKMLMIVALCFGAACGLMAATAHTAMVVLAFFLLRLFGQGSLTLVSGHALAMWFHRRLGTLSGVRAVVVYVSWVPLPGLTLWLFDAIGWRQTWALYGALIAVLLPALSWALVRDRPEDLGLHLDGAVAKAPTDPGASPGHSLHSAMRTPAYWALAFVSTLAPMMGTAMLFDLEPLLAARSMDATVAASCASAWSATMAIAALPTGWLVDRVSARHVVGTGVVLLASSCLLLVAADSAPAALAAMTALGIGTTFVGSAVATTTARHFGREHHGAIRSSLGRIAVIATGLGPLAFGVSQRLTGAVAAALYCFAALCVPAATCVLALPRGTAK